MITLNHVSKIIDNQVVLNNINISLENNKIYGFIGRNGSGKSILFRLICGLIYPTTGTIMIDNKNISENQQFPSSIGALINKPKFLDQLSGFDNLCLLASIQNVIAESDIEDILKKVGLEKEQNKKFGKYSLGMKQKLGIAQAIMENPNIVILDEPFSGLDKQSVDNMRNLVYNLKRKDRIILISSHIKEDIEILCDEVFELDQGEIIDKYKVKKSDF